MLYLSESGASCKKFAERSVCSSRLGLECPLRQSPANAGLAADVRNSTAVRHNAHDTMLQLAVDAFRPREASKYQPFFIRLIVPGRYGVYPTVQSVDLHILNSLHMSHSHLRRPGRGSWRDTRPGKLSRRDLVAFAQSRSTH